MNENSSQDQTKTVITSGYYTNNLKKVGDFLFGAILFFALVYPYNLIENYYVSVQNYNAANNLITIYFTPVIILYLIIAVLCAKNRKFISIGLVVGLLALIIFVFLGAIELMLHFT